MRDNIIVYRGTPTSKLTVSIHKTMLSVTPMTTELRHWNLPSLGPPIPEIPMHGTHPQTTMWDKSFTAKTLSVETAETGTLPQSLLSCWLLPPLGTGTPPSCWWPFPVTLHHESVPVLTSPKGWHFQLQTELEKKDVVVNELMEGASNDQPRSQVPKKSNTTGVCLGGGYDKGHSEYLKGCWQAEAHCLELVRNAAQHEVKPRHRFWMDGDLEVCILQVDRKHEVVFLDGVEDWGNLSIWNKVYFTNRLSGERSTTDLHPQWISLHGTTRCKSPKSAARQLWGCPSPISSPPLDDDWWPWRNPTCKKGILGLESQ